MLGTLLDEKDGSLNRWGEVTSGETLYKTAKVFGKSLLALPSHIHDPMALSSQLEAPLEVFRCVQRKGSYPQGGSDG